MTHIVISHGAWGAAWEWYEVGRGLMRVGHDVLVPSLTGLGDREHLAHPGVDLHTHIRDVSATILAARWTEVTLVGHSYSGMVITGVAHAIPDRLARLVYVDAFVPQADRSLFDLLPDALAEQMRSLAREQGDGWQIPLPWSVEGAPPEVQEFAARSTPQPLGCFDTPLPFSGSVDNGLPATYIKLTEAGPDDPVAESAMRGRELGWEYLQVAGPHDAQVFQPDLIRAALEESLLG